MTTNELARFIRSHECAAIVLLDGQIMATCQAVKDGKVFDETSILPPTLQAVRDWLGY